MPVLVHLLIMSDSYWKISWQSTCEGTIYLANCVWRVVEYILMSLLYEFVIEGAIPSNVLISREPHTLQLCTILNSCVRNSITEQLIILNNTIHHCGLCQSACWPPPSTAHTSLCATSTLSDCKNSVGWRRRYCTRRVEIIDRSSLCAVSSITRSSSISLSDKLLVCLAKKCVSWVENKGYRC